MSNKSIISVLDVLTKASSDNERFAALLLVAKAIKADKTDAETRKQIFDAVGFKFLNRLLRSGSVPEGCSKYAYKSLSLAILSSFCSDSELVIHEDMLSNLPAIGRLLTDVEKDESDVEAQPMIDDAYDCLSCIAAHPVGLDAVIQHKVVTSLCTAVAFWNLGWPKAHQLLMYVINQRGPEAWEGNTDGLHTIVSAYTKNFTQSMDESKFGVCTTLYILLSSTERHQIVTRHQAWSNALRDGLEGVLRSKIASSQRDPALKLSCLLVDLLGVPWAVGTDRQKFLLLLVHLACIEVRMALEDHTLEQVSGKGALLSPCYMLLEHTIAYMTSGPSLALDDKQLRQLHSAMTGAINAVLYFLSNVDAQHRDQSTAPVVLASVRALGAWIAEETTALKDEVLKLLPFLLHVGKCSFDGHKKNNDEEECEDVVKFLLPGLCHISAEDKSRKVILDSNTHELLGQYLTFLWAEYKNISCEDLSKVKQCEGDMESLSLSEKMGKREDSLRKGELEKGLTTLCGVLLNLIVLEVDLVKSHPMFEELQAFAVTNLPVIGQTEESTVLSFNIMVIGLMLCRHLTHKESVNKSSLDNFFSTSITLLSRCHHSKSGAKSLIITESYECYWSDCSELWFLGMQVLCECISLYPESLTYLILKNGWLPAAMKMLIEATGSIEEVVCYRALFCETARCSKDAKKIISQKGGKELIKKYEMDQLQKILDS